MFKRKYLFKLGLEIIAIIIGISASFWLSEISQSKDKEIQRDRVISSILSETEDIQDYCDERMKIWNQDIEIYNLLLKQKLDLDELKNVAISKNRVEHNLIYHREFDPPMNRYTSLINTGDFKYIESDNVKETLTRLHNINFTKVKSTEDYEKKILEMIVELISNEKPSIFLNGNDSRISFESYLAYLHDYIQRSEKLKSNLTVQLKYFKTRVSSLRLYNITLEELHFELKNIANTN